MSKSWKSIILRLFYESRNMLPIIPTKVGWEVWGVGGQEKQARRPQKGKGKARRPKKEKSKWWQTLLRSNSTRQPDRKHARTHGTTRKDFPVGLTSHLRFNGQSHNFRSSRGGVGWGQGSRRVWESANLPTDIMGWPTGPSLYSPHMSIDVNMVWGALSVHQMTHLLQFLKAQAPELHQQHL